MDALDKVTLISLFNHYQTHLSEKQDPDLGDVEKDILSGLKVKMAILKDDIKEGTDRKTGGPAVIPSMNDHESYC